MQVSDPNSSEPPGDRRRDALGNLRVLPDELVCAILDYLSPRDVARLACVSSVVYILCNEEPLWMSQCLNRANGPIEYKGTWKKTALHIENLPAETVERCEKQLRFDGFMSWFLYKRFYRCHASLDGFNFDKGKVERKIDPTPEEFSSEYDGKKPVLLTGLADSWPARETWTTEQLSVNYGDTTFKISQRSSRKTSMKFKDYVSYMKLQHDEDPLYIFDDKFGEVAPGLLKDYNVPQLFREDYFDVLDRDQRPPFRWLIVGPERSGASWHVDPALTSAWNTLLCGRKRWALYPPGRVPLGVTVHVNEEDGDVNIETPTSLQWWLDFYPLLADEDKPIECTQLPGETIYVPSGWWHCILNLETTIAVTQNFVNSTNFEFVCLDMAPGYRHKGVCRAGLLALDDDSIEDVKNKMHENSKSSYSELTRKEKKLKVLESGGNSKHNELEDVVSKNYDLWKNGFSYDINFLSMFLDKERDHYNSPWSSGNCMGQREMREWLYRLWVGKPGMRDLIWKGACVALDAGRLLKCMEEISAFHNLPSATELERLPVGTGSNPVYLVADSVVKIFVEEGLEASLYGLGTELEFHGLLHKANSPLKNHIPEVLGSGILYIENGTYKIESWDGSAVPNVVSGCDFLSDKHKAEGFPFGIWSKQQYVYRKAGISITESINSEGSTNIWPYIITKRCKGKIFAQLRNTLESEDMLSLVSFLGEQLRNLHLLPRPPYISVFSDVEPELEVQYANGDVGATLDVSNFPAEWDIFIRTLNRRKKDVSSRLKKWGYPIPNTLIDKVDEYIPNNFSKLLFAFEDENEQGNICKPFSWIHSDIMDDNIHMEPRGDGSYVNGVSKQTNHVDSGYANPAFDDSLEGKSWLPSHILDFSDLSLGDPICDLIPIHLDVFRGDSFLFKRFLESYKLPLLTSHRSVSSGDKFGRLSYHAMCYCIVHDDNVLGAIFDIWDELMAAKSWEEVELTVWGELNNYKGCA